MLQLAGMMPFKTTQIVGGAVSGGTAGPYTTNFTLSTALIDYAKAMVIPLFGGTPYSGNTPSGDYFKWRLSSTSNLEVTTFQTSWTSLAKCYWLVLEFFTCKGKVTASTNITGATAADFDVTVTPPEGASLAQALPVMTCLPLDSGGNGMRVGLSLPGLTTVRFGFPGCAYNTSKPVQAEIMFF